MIEDFVQVHWSGLASVSVDRATIVSLADSGRYFEVVAHGQALAMDDIRYMAAVR